MNKFSRNRKKSLSAAVAVALISSIMTVAGPAEAAKTELVVGSTQGIPQLNPIIQTFAAEVTLWPLLWSGLTRRTVDGTVKPDLAKSWKTNASGTTWVFTLSPGAKFSDGSPLDPAAVKATFLYVLEKKTVSQRKSEIDMIKTMTTTKDTITFDLKTPNALFSEGVSDIRIIKVSEVKNFNKHPATSGPFMVKTFSPNVALKLVQNPKYFGPKPKITGISFVKAADPTAAVTSLRSGDIDFMYELPLVDAAPLAKDPSLKIVKAPVSSIPVAWEMDLTSAPFNNVKARQALAYSVNRQAMLNAAYYGFGTVSTYGTIVADKSKWQCGAAAGLTQYTFDLEKAKALFAEAGVTSFTWWGVSGILPEFDAMGQILQADLKKIGIDMKIENNEVGIWAAKFYPAGKSYPNLVVPNYFSLQYEPAYSMFFPKTGGFEANWNNAQYDAAYDKAIGTVDAKERAKLWCVGMKMENQQLPIISPFTFDKLHASQKNISGIWVESTGDVHLEGAVIK
ncbi:MAG: ABC transporter substrate-binding protein [Actinobacteria bacterium]|nr:ABC transporter substrate-binding protein [Actinomycetota bacterium]